MLVLLFSCSQLPLKREECFFRVFSYIPTRSSDPSDEEMISDLNIFIFNHSGELEEKRFISGGKLVKEGSEYVFSSSLLLYEKYSVYVCANLGYALDAESEPQLRSYRYYLAYPDEYSKGIPMTGCIRNIIPASNDRTIGLERMMSRISVVFDRSSFRRKPY